MQQAAGAGHDQHRAPIGMPTGAVVVSRGAAGGANPTRVQGSESGSGVAPAGAALVRL